MNEHILKSKSIELNPDLFEVRVHDQIVTLTADQFDLLEALMLRFGCVMTRQQIVKDSKGEDYPCTDKAVDVAIHHLRKKIPRDLIEAVRGRGYRFVERVTKVPATAEVL